MYSNTISLRYFFPRARILNEIAEFEKMPLNRKTLKHQTTSILKQFESKLNVPLPYSNYCKNSLNYSEAMLSNIPLRERRLMEFLGEFRSSKRLIKEMH